jgi:hypothetical protein
MRGSLLLLLAVSACHPLGPVPIATGVSPIPRARFDGELQLGIVPGYYLGAATAKTPKAAPFGQASLLIEPGFVPGLILGGRTFGPSYDSAADPLIGYRTSLGPDKRFALSAVGFGAHQSGSYQGATYDATRVGAEVTGDLRLGMQRPWFEPHLEMALSFTAISAKGDYCTDVDGYGTDCPKPPALPLLHHAEASGAYPAVTVGATLLFAHHHESWFHGARALVLIGAGLMPRIVNEQQASAQPYASFGFALSISLGAPR